MAALVAAHARETFGEVAALHELVDHFRVLLDFQRRMEEKWG